MNKWSKIGLTVGMGCATLASAHFINKLIFSQSISESITDKENMRTYGWKFGSISYSVYGQGPAILLIHELASVSSSYEWKKSITSLSKHHTVYTIDLLGCGHSSKPNITYTTYMYTQLISDFIENVIQSRTSVIATGNSAPIAIMSAYHNPSIIDKIILVGPQSIKNAMITPNKRSNMRKFLLTFPVIGTLIYNTCMSTSEVEKTLSRQMNSTPNVICKNLIKAYHENAHLSGANAKFLHASIVGRYTTVTIGSAVCELDHCIYIISGDKDVHANATQKEYTDANPAIECFSIAGSKHLPQLENPEEFYKTVNLLL